MSKTENVDARDIIDRMYEIQDLGNRGFLIGYCRGTDYKGDLEGHNFLAYGDEIVGSEFITGFSGLVKYHECSDSWHPCLVFY